MAISIQATHFNSCLTSTFLGVVKGMTDGKGMTGRLCAVMPNRSSIVLERQAELYECCRSDPDDLFAGKAGARLMDAFLTWKPVEREGPGRSPHGASRSRSRRLGSYRPAVVARLVEPSEPELLISGVDSAAPLAVGSRVEAHPAAVPLGANPALAFGSRGGVGHTRGEAARVTDGVLQHVPDCVECFDRVFFALLAPGVSFNLPPVGCGIRRKVDHVSAILVDLDSRGWPHYVGITHSPDTRWHGMYTDASGAQVGHSRKDEYGVRCAYPGHKHIWERMKVVYVTESAEANALLELHIIAKHGRSPYMTNKSKGGEATAASREPPYFTYVCHDTVTA